MGGWRHASARGWYPCAAPLASPREPPPPAPLTSCGLMPKISILADLMAKHSVSISARASLSAEEAELKMRLFSFQRPLNVTVTRRGERHQLRLVPTRWAGKGLLG